MTEWLINNNLNCECSYTGNNARTEKDFGENSKCPDGLLTIPTDALSHFGSLKLFFRDTNRVKNSSEHETGY